MGKKKYLVSLVALSALALPFVYGCNSSDTAGGGRDDDSDVFVADETNSGRIELSVANTTIPVGGTSSFSALVYDANGAPVPHINVVCDSEVGIAIIEPTQRASATSSFEMTDEHGHMSGVVGCTLPGSFQFMCRLPAGGAERKYVSIHCTGDGSASWAGAAGGGLGGGVDSGDESGVNEGKLRITHIDFSDGGNTGLTIDTVFTSDCDGKADTVDPELFTDAFINITVSNTTSELVVFSSYKYVVENYNNAGGTFNSNTLSLVGDTPVAGDGGTHEFHVPFMEAVGANDKRFYGSSVDFQAAWEGFKNIKIALYGTTDSGKPVVLTAGVSAGIGGYNNCK